MDETARQIELLCYEYYQRLPDGTYFVDLNNIQITLPGVSYRLNKSFRRLIALCIVRQRPGFPLWDITRYSHNLVTLVRRDS